MAASVYATKKAAMKAENIVEWAKENPQPAKLLAHVERLIQEMESDA